MTYWPNIDYYEPAVNFALRKLIKPGMTIFDVGANEGILSVIASRATGPSGKVIAFEGSPRILENLHTNLRDNHATNAHIVNSYVSDQHDEIVSIYHNSDSAVADSMMAQEGQSPNAWVKSIRLDQFIEETAIKPDIIKVDVEGAEPLVLESLRSFFEQGERPLIILESWQDTQSQSILDKYGYNAFDLHAMQDIAMDDVAFINANILFYPKNISCPLPFADHKNVMREHSGTEFKKSGKNFELAIDSLARGDYLFQIISSDNKRDADVRIEVYSAGYLQILGCSNWCHILSHYAQQPFETYVDGPLTIRMGNIPTRDFSVKIIKLR